MALCASLVWPRLDTQTGDNKDESRETSPRVTQVNRSGQKLRIQLNWENRSENIDKIALKFKTFSLYNPIHIENLLSRNLDKKLSRL